MTTYARETKTGYKSVKHTYLQRISKQDFAVQLLFRMFIVEMSVIVCDLRDNVGSLQMTEEMTLQPGQHQNMCLQLFTDCIIIRVSH